MGRGSMLMYCAFWSRISSMRLATSSSVTSGSLVGNLDALVVPQLDFGNHFELGREAQRLAIVEVDVLDIGRADHVQVLGLELLLAGTWGSGFPAPAAGFRRRTPCEYR